MKINLDRQKNFMEAVVLHEFGAKDQLAAASIFISPLLGFFDITFYYPYIHN